jgi:hypothetical protein
MDAPEPDRRRLNRAIRWNHEADGVYGTADAMRSVRRVSKRKWQEGVRQPYHADGEYQYHDAAHRRLRDAQAALETAETRDPRREALEVPFHDRRGY